jgi:hypothetical protein
MLLGNSQRRAAPYQRSLALLHSNRRSSRNKMRDGLLYLPVASHDDVWCREDEQTFTAVEKS